MRKVLWIALLLAAGACLTNHPSITVVSVGAASEIKPLRNESTSGFYVPPVVRYTSANDTTIGQSGVHIFKRLTDDTLDNLDNKVSANLYGDWIVPADQTVRVQLVLDSWDVVPLDAKGQRIHGATEYSWLTKDIKAFVVIDEDHHLQLSIPTPAFSN